MRTILSSEWARLSFLCLAPAPHPKPVHIDEWLENDKALAEHAAAGAVADAKRVLGMAEPAVTDAWGQAWAHQPAYRTPPRSQGTFISEGHAALAEAITAALPLLDALAAD